MTDLECLLDLLFINKSATAAYFAYAAYPFYQHALGVRVECIDCHMSRLSFDFSNVTSGGWLLAQSLDTDDSASFSTTSSVGDNETTGGRSLQFIQAALHPDCH